MKFASDQVKTYLTTPFYCTVVISCHWAVFVPVVYNIDQRSIYTMLSIFTQSVSQKLQLYFIFISMSSNVYVNTIVNNHTHGNHSSEDEYGYN